MVQTKFHATAIPFHHARLGRPLCRSVPGRPTQPVFRTRHQRACRRGSRPTKLSPAPRMSTPPSAARPASTCCGNLRRSARTFTDEDVVRAAVREQSAIKNLQKMTWCYDSGMRSCTAGTWRSLSRPTASWPTGPTVTCTNAEAGPGAVAMAGIDQQSRSSTRLPVSARERWAVHQTRHALRRWPWTTWHPAGIARFVRDAVAAAGRPAGWSNPGRGIAVVRVSTRIP